MRVQEGCERRSEVFVKIKKNRGGGCGRVSGWGVRVRGSGWVGGVGQGGCERRSEVFVKIKKKSGWVGSAVVRMDLNKELKFCEKKKNNLGVGVGLGGQGGCEWNEEV